jgi:hypothetical protein
MINDFTKPKPIDWTPSFLSSRKSPYGAYILHNELNSFFPKSKIKKTYVTPYEYISEHYDVLDNEDDYKNKLTYFFLNNYIKMGEESCQDLLSFVELGNTVFMAGKNFPNYLADSLHFKTEYLYSTTEKEMILELANKNISRTKYNYKKAVGNNYFTELDSINTVVLGYNKELDLEDKQINFVKIKYGKGNFILNTQPYAFTNYHMLESNHAVYVADCFSYIPDNNILWDERNKAQSDEIKSKLRFILSKPALKYAWFTTLGALLLFMIFRAKRRQRIIPIIEKLPNTSIAFAKTIGNLYYQEGNPKDIINKKITFFLEYLRNTYLLDTQNLNSDFKKRLHHKTGVPQDEINRLIDYVYNLSNNSEPQENSLMTLNKLIDKFYKKTQLKKD